MPIRATASLKMEMLRPLKSGLSGGDGPGESTKHFD